MTSDRLYRTLRLLALFVCLLFGSSACSKTLIPNTDVQDTTENRKIILFCEDYRKALENKDVPQLLKMMSTTYFENGGTSQGDDDADFDQMKEFLSGDFLQATGIRYEIRYRRITIKESGKIHVEFTYAGAYKIPGARGAEWNHKVADNRLDLITVGDSFKITKGM